MIAELADIAYQWSQPFVSDPHAYETQVAPAEVTPHATAIPATVRYFQQVLGVG